MLNGVYGERKGDRRVIFDFRDHACGHDPAILLRRDRDQGNGDHWRLFFLWGEPRSWYCYMRMRLYRGQSVLENHLVVSRGRPLGGGWRMKPSRVNSFEALDSTCVFKTEGERYLDECLNKESES